jgi:hypothetical protein
MRLTPSSGSAKCGRTTEPDDISGRKHCVNFVTPYPGKRIWKAALRNMNLPATPKCPKQPDSILVISIFL